MNYFFDIDELLPKLPLQPRNDRFSADIITSPCHVCNNEHLRQEAANQFDWGPAVAMDIFIMAEGEPQDRHVTKIGGLPYRPANLEWPSELDGSPLTFLAQFDFTDSADITGHLPGDVLLVFTSDNGAEGEVESFHFEWQSLGMTDLISPVDVPEQKWRLDPSYGHLYRTVNYPRAQRTAASKKTKYPICRGKEIWSSRHLLQYQGTQIGQAPFLIQSGDDDLPGRILCVISSVGPDQHKAYPWVNRPEPLMPEGKWRYDYNYLAIQDAGCIYISIDEDGQLHSNQSSY